MIVKMIIDAIKEARRSIARSMKDHKEQRKNARLWKENERLRQQVRETRFARPNSTASLKVFEPVTLFTFSQMIEVHGGKLKRERFVYIAVSNIESVRSYQDFDDDHSVITCGGVEYIVFGNEDEIVGALQLGVDTRPESDW